MGRQKFNSSAAIISDIILEEVDTSINEAYQRLNIKCDEVMDKIKKRKIKNNINI